jgi:hypothetical protein
MTNITRKEFYREKLQDEFLDDKRLETLETIDDCDTCKSLDQEPNQVVATISRVHCKPASHWAHMFTIEIQNTVDDCDNYVNNDSDDIPGYLEAEDLESILKQAKAYLRDVFMQNLKHVKVIVEEDD